MSLHNISPLPNFHSPVKDYLERNTPEDGIQDQFITDLMQSNIILSRALSNVEKRNENLEGFYEYISNLDRDKLKEVNSFISFTNKLTENSDELKENEELIQPYRSLLVKLIKLAQNHRNSEFKMKVLNLVESL